VRDGGPHFDLIIEQRRDQELSLDVHGREAVRRRAEHILAGDAHLARQGVRGEVHPLEEAREKRDPRRVAVTPAHLRAHHEVARRRVAAVSHRASSISAAGGFSDA
jgi:hypothetical protein